MTTIGHINVGDLIDARNTGHVCEVLRVRESGNPETRLVRYTRLSGPYRGTFEDVVWLDQPIYQYDLAGALNAMPEPMGA